MKKASDPRQLPDLVEQALRDAIGRISGKRRAVMFSGGFDSMLIAVLAERCGAKVTAVTIRFEDFNPLTVAASVVSARQLGLKHLVLDVSCAEFLSAFDKLPGVTHESVTDLDLAVVFAALKKYDRKKAGDVLVSGMGCDQWFGNEALKVRSADRDEFLKKMKRDLKAHQRAAGAYGLEFHFPFLSASMLSLAQTIPASMKKDKKLLRGIDLARQIPHSGRTNEIQVPVLIRSILAKTYKAKDKCLTSHRNYL